MQHATSGAGGRRHQPGDIMCLTFNQEQNLFACSTDSGLRIYNVDPLMVKTCLGESFDELISDWTDADDEWRRSV